MRTEDMFITQILSQTWFRNSSPKKTFYIHVSQNMFFRSTSKTLSETCQKYIFSILLYPNILYQKILGVSSSMFLTLSDSHACFKITPSRQIKEIGKYDQNKSPSLTSKGWEVQSFHVPWRKDAQENFWSQMRREKTNTIGMNFIRRGDGSQNLPFLFFRILV